MAVAVEIAGGTRFTQIVVQE